MPRKSLGKSALQQRENDLLGVASHLFLTKGIDGLTMDKLAAGAGHAKGTVYQHFSSKEDVLAALCLESSRIRLALLERAALFKGRSRERALAVAKADYIVYRLHPDYWRVEQLTDVLSLTTKISPAHDTSGISPCCDFTFSPESSSDTGKAEPTAAAYLFSEYSVRRTPRRGPPPAQDKVIHRPCTRCSLGFASEQVVKKKCFIFREKCRILTPVP